MMIITRSAIVPIADRVINGKHGSLRPINPSDFKPQINDRHIQYKLNEALENIQLPSIKKVRNEILTVAGVRNRFVLKREKHFQLSPVEVYRLKLNIHTAMEREIILVWTYLTRIRNEVEPENLRNQFVKYLLKAPCGSDPLPLHFFYDGIDLAIFDGVSERTV